MPRGLSQRSSLFTNRSNAGKIIMPSLGSREAKDLIVLHLQGTCRVLTTNQRCADRFTLSQFRITGTIAGKTLLDDEEITTLLDTPKNTPRTSAI